MRKLLVLICLVAAAEIRAATYTVTNTSDIGAGSLRDAIDTASATPENDTIVFAIPAGSAGCSTAGVCTISVFDELYISGSGSLTITGPGADRLIVSGAHQPILVFHINGATTTISGITIRDGEVALRTQAALNVTLNDCLITENHNTYRVCPGVDHNGGAMTINRCAITNNSTAVPEENTAPVILTGGGVSTSSDSGFTLRNSTVSGNRILNGQNGQRRCAGGIFVSSNVFITNSTITDNEVVGTPNGNSQIFGGGVYLSGGSMTFQSSVIAGNRNSRTTTPDLAGSSGAIFFTQGYNFIGNRGVVGAAGTPEPTDQYGVPGAVLDAALGTLDYNGGPTPTHKPQPGSPLIDRGKSNGYGVDQRNVARPYDDPGLTNQTGGDGADIGAVELRPAVDNLRVTAVLRQGNGTILVQAVGGAGATYTLKSADDLAQPFTNTVGTAMAGGDGTFQLQETPPANVTRRFYRIVYP